MMNNMTMTQYFKTFACDDCSQYAKAINDQLFCTDLQTFVEFGKRHPDCKLKIQEFDR